MLTLASGVADLYSVIVGGRSDESAPDDDSPEVYAAGQGHDRCYRMHMLDQINALVAVADAGEGGGGGWEYGFVGQRRGQD